MKYVIIEDEILAARRLRELMDAIRPNYEFVSKFDSVEGATISLPVLKYDLILMDIQLADGNSFDIFDQITLKTPVIFTTAYDEYAIKAFKTNSIDYLLKPIDESELQRAVEKFEENQVAKSGAAQPSFEITDLIKTLSPGGKERFVVKIGDHLKTVETPNIQMVYSQDKGTYLFTNDGKKFLIDYSLDKVEELLSANQFFRISRKFMVNIGFIKDIIAFTNSRLEIVIEHFGDEQIIVARERVADFKAWLDR
ncbi:MAG: LytTR family DNA-binding domain-containing protein [Cyclobacteriaceae bacterium]